MLVHRPAAALFATLGVAASLFGCKPVYGPPACRSTLSMFTSPASGVVTLKGQFYANESILIYDVATNSIVAQGTPATDRTTFTLVGVPSGTREYLIKASCASGQETIDEGDFTVS